MKTLFFGWLLPASAAGGAAALILAAVSPLLLRFDCPKQLRRLCILVMVMFWLPAGVFSSAQPAMQPVVRRVLPGPAASAHQFVQQVAAPFAGQPVHEDTAVNWRVMAVLLWAAGACVLLILFAADWRIFCRQAARTSVPAGPELAACLNDEAARIGIKNRTLPRLVVCGRVGGPMLAGLRRPVILLPGTAVPGSALRCALAHELCHWRAGDLIFKWAALFTAAVHWYNPAIWLLVLLFERSCEYACDAVVVAGMGEKERFDYGAALLELHSVQLPVSASGFSAAGHRLKRRLIMVLQPEKKNTAARRILALLAVTGILAAGLLCGCSAAALSNSEQPPDSLPISSSGAQTLQTDSSGIPAEEQFSDSQSKADDPASETKSASLVESEEAENQSAVTQADIPDTLTFPIGEGYKYWSRGFTEDHPAVDLAARYGSPIYAAADGEVLEATAALSESGSWFGTWPGIYIILDHGGWQTAYTHCSALAVEPGTQVTQGQVIGYVGATGNATGNFCHFMVLENGVEIDPAPLLGLVSE